MTGTLGRSARRNSSPEKPRTPGIERSSRTRSISGISFQRDREAFEIDGLVDEGAGNGAAHGLA